MEEVCVCPCLEAIEERQTHQKTRLPFTIYDVPRDQGFTTEANTTVPLNGVVTFSGSVT